MAQSNKTEKPTGRRLEKARREGQFVSSRELVAAAQFLVFVSILGMGFTGWFTRMKDLLTQALAQAFHTDLDITTFPSLAGTLLQRAFVPLSVLAALTVVVTLGIHLAVTKMGVSMKKMAPDFNRFNPATKIRQIVRQGPAGLLRASIMLVLFGSTIYVIAKQNAEIFLALPFAGLDVALQRTGMAIKDLLWKAAAVFVVFGLVDLFRQRRLFMKDLRMTKQEVKEEQKESEGNPLVKGKIRRLRRDMARRRMMKEIPAATAVIVNPTHFAVALRYQHDISATPMVVAKGKNYLALRIKQLAIESGVPLVENPPLAQALYKSVDVGKEIPPHLYRAVAEVLAYIYKLTKVRRGSVRQS